MVKKTNYPNTVVMTDKDMQDAINWDHIDIYHGHSNRHMAHIPKSMIERFVKSGKRKKTNPTMFVGGMPIRMGMREFWVCVIPKECEIKCSQQH